MSTNPVTRTVICISIAVLLACGSKAADPDIRITTAPRYDPQGGSNSSGQIEGRVVGVAAQDFRVVIFSRTDYWYVQPEESNPYTPISKDGHWRATIRIGTRYAALLVRSSYKPPTRISVLPNESTDPQNIVASAEAEGSKTTK